MDSNEDPDYDEGNFNGGYGLPGRNLGNQNARGKGPYQQGFKQKRQGSRKGSLKQKRQRSKQSRTRGRYEENQDGGYGCPCSDNQGRGKNQTGGYNEDGRLARIGTHLDPQWRANISRALMNNHNARGKGPYQHGTQDRQGSKKSSSSARKSSSSARKSSSSARKGSAKKTSRKSGSTKRGSKRGSRGRK